MGDVLIHHLWQRQADTIIDVRVTDTDVKYYISSSLNSVMDIQEKKKIKYLLPCLFQQKNFTPFLVSLKRILGRESKILFKQIYLRLATNWECLLSQAHT